MSKNIVDSGFNNFLCSSGCFSLLSCLTGGRNAPYILQCVLQKYILNNKEGAYDPIVLSIVKCFYDDLSLGSYENHGLETHLQDLDVLLSRIINSGLRLSFDKCKFAIDLKHKDVTCLGFKVGFNQVNPIQPAK